MTTRLGVRPLASGLRRTVLALVLVLAVPNVFTVLDLWGSWRQIERVDFDPDAARESLQTVPTTTTIPLSATTSLGPGSSSPSSTTTTTEPLPDLPEDLQTFLIVGQDYKDRPEADEVVRADAIMLGAVDRNGGRLAVISIPRDTQVPDPCGGPDRRIQELLDGCHGISGPDLISVAVEDLLLVPIDHYAVVGFESFRGAIDRLGGMQVCLDYDFTYSPTASPLLRAGCNTYDGYTVLQWLRIRVGVQLVDGDWVALEGGDFARMDRQRSVLIGLFTMLKGVRDPGTLADLAEELTDGLVLDGGFDLGETVSLAWEVRSIPSSAIRSAGLPVRDEITGDGFLVAIPTRDPASFARSVLVG